MLTAEERRLIEFIRARPECEADSALLDYTLERIREAKPPWVPKLGDRVVLTDGVSDERYDVVKVARGECQLMWDGTLQDGWFRFSSLAPAPGEED